MSRHVSLGASALEIIAARQGSPTSDAAFDSGGAAEIHRFAPQQAKKCPRIDDWLLGELLERRGVEAYWPDCSPPQQLLPVAGRWFACRQAANELQKNSVLGRAARRLGKNDLSRMLLVDPTGDDEVQSIL